MLAYIQHELAVEIARRGITNDALAELTGDAARTVKNKRRGELWIDFSDVVAWAAAVSSTGTYCSSPDPRASLPSVYAAWAQHWQFPTTQKLAFRSPTGTVVDWQTVADSVAAEVARLVVRSVDGILTSDGLMTTLAAAIVDGGAPRHSISRKARRTSTLTIAGPPRSAVHVHVAVRPIDGDDVGAVDQAFDSVISAVAVAGADHQSSILALVVSPAVLARFEATYSVDMTTSAPSEVRLPATATLRSTMDRPDLIDERALTTDYILRVAGTANGGVHRVIVAAVDKPEAA